MKTLAAALMMSAGLMSASAFAGSNVEPNNIPFQGVYGAQEDAGSLSRAQVKADLAQAKANGLVANVEPNDMPFQAAYSDTASTQLSRADVQAQAVGMTSNVEPNDTPFVAQAPAARNDALAAE
ncbi:Uncharacterised protein [Bordetella ansorpii]|uniref:DUF4148 domain-containing protein n=1 Tax=Bordetella ansorpii TaxID=288768 RepID=A0A146AZ77_9BORD|nr:DUF4148 domain-containing protein [Bordetella ansorpii]CZZ95723.1 Uncharacterised protein [Bordetella ansorpii]